MNERIDTQRRRVAIPAHPIWCAEFDKSVPQAHGLADTFLHRDQPYHAELQGFDISFSIGLVQYDEPSEGENCGRCINEPALEVIVASRVTTDRIDFEIRSEEARQLIAVLQKGLSDLEHVVDMARDPSSVARWALGWTPAVRR